MQLSCTLSWVWLGTLLTECAALESTVRCQPGESCRSIQLCCGNVIHYSFPLWMSLLAVTAGKTEAAALNVYMDVCTPKVIEEGCSCCSCVAMECPCWMWLTVKNTGFLTKIKIWFHCIFSQFPFNHKKHLISNFLGLSLWWFRLEGTIRITKFQSSAISTELITHLKAVFVSVLCSAAGWGGLYCKAHHHQHLGKPCVTSSWERFSSTPVY